MPKRRNLTKSFKPDLTARSVAFHVHFVGFQEMIDHLRESLIHIMHTRDGAHVAMECLWHGSKKDRKVITDVVRLKYKRLADGRLMINYSAEYAILIFGHS